MPSQDASRNEELPGLLKACEAGDIAVLEDLFHTAEYLSSPRSQSRILYAAVKHNQLNSVKRLLEIWPSLQVRDDGILGIEFANPDLPTLEILYRHDPSIVNYEFGEMCVESLLMEHCSWGNSRVVEFLLDHGANPNGTGFPLPGNTPLIIALARQPSHIIRKIVQCGARVSNRDVERAIYYERTEMLDFLLSHIRQAKAKRKWWRFWL